MGYSLPTENGCSRHGFSRKMVLLTGIVIFSAATALTTLVPGFWTMLVCLAAQGTRQVVDAGHF